MSWRSVPGDEGAFERAVQLRERAGLELPFDMLVRVARWRRLASFVAEWHDRPLTERDGCSPGEIDASEKRVGVALPRCLREWYRLVGRRGDVMDGYTSPVRPDGLALD